MPLIAALEQTLGRSTFAIRASKAARLAYLSDTLPPTEEGAFTQYFIKKLLLLVKPTLAIVSFARTILINCFFAAYILS